MQQLKTKAFAIAFFMCSLAFAGANPAEKDKPESIGEAVAEMLTYPELDLTSDEFVTVAFKVNAKNQIEVLSVETDDYFLKRFITFRLNHEKVNEDLVKTKSHFKVLIKFSELD
jgi:hypothetical protein